MQDPLTNPRHEIFAQLVATGKTATAAYKKAGYTAKTRSAISNACRLLTKADILDRVGFLRKKTEARLELSREKLAEHLWDVVFTPIGNIDAQSPLCQESKITEDKDGNVTTLIKSSGKVESARLLCDMQGWKEPEKIINEDGEKRIASARERAKSIKSPLNRLHQE
tara:strand:- start:950 stop:1450 length:501 start_codon:yes stop_codon:yes gene_type:complete